jgi:Protein of unknown function (DUF2934)
MGEVERDNRDQIAKKAFEIYESRGGGGGHEMEDWMEAERQVTETGKAESARTQFSGVAETGTPEESARAEFSGGVGQQFRPADVSPQPPSETLEEQAGYPQGQAE